jgi:hypothetical protein
MKPTNERAPRRKRCPTCDQLIYLNRSGLYRRHYTEGSDGGRHICAGSGSEFQSAERAGEQRGVDV